MFVVCEMLFRQCFRLFLLVKNVHLKQTFASVVLLIDWLHGGLNRLTPVLIVYSSSDKMFSLSRFQNVRSRWKALLTHMCIMSLLRDISFVLLMLNLSFLVMLVFICVVRCGLLRCTVCLTKIWPSLYGTVRK